MSDPGPLPPLRVAAINVKAVPDAKDKAQEIVGVSVLHMTMPMDRPLDMKAWQSAHNIRRLSVVCPTSGASCPPGLQNLVKVPFRPPMSAHCAFPNPLCCHCSKSRQQEADPPPSAYTMPGAL